MRLRVLLMMALCTQLALPALAADPSAYPVAPTTSGVFFDTNCGDANDTVSAPPFSRPEDQWREASGSANNKCDKDYRVLKGVAQASTVLFGACGQITGSCASPFRKSGLLGMLVVLNTTANTGNWGVCVYHQLQYEPGTWSAIACTTGIGTATLGRFYIGDQGIAYATSSGTTQALEVVLPDEFVIGIVPSTSWTGDAMVEWVTAP